MLGSDFDGERSAAGLAASRLLKTKGLVWNDVISAGLLAPPSPAPTNTWRSDLTICARHISSLRVWEKGFVQSLSTRTTISPKQRRVLTEIVAVLRARGLT